MANDSTWETNDFRQQDNPTPPPPPPPPIRTQYTYQEPPRKRSGRSIFLGIMLTLSVLGNIVLFLALIGIAVMGSLGDSGFQEEVLKTGPQSNKIVIVTIEGLIDDKMSEHVRHQMAMIAQDSNIRAIIVQINSPGGGVAASDRIHSELLSMRNQLKLPFVAYMRDMAASGGYYTAVACNRIIAEPTTITGSIGVIMSSFVVKDLLEEKLGIQPVVIKAGARKDWPNPFSEVTQEQRDYLHQRLIDPAYERFVSIVEQGRPGLSSAQVRQLADGSIYTGDQAQKDGLVDQVGYFNDAIETAMAMAGIQDAMIVRYRAPFSLTQLLRGSESDSKSILRLDRNQLHEMAVPQLMYLWQ